MGSQAETLLWSDDKYEIRPARNTDEFREMWWDFMQLLGWNRGYYDLDTYMNPSLGYGMLLLVEKASGKPVGHVSAVLYPNSTGWVSMFIIDEAHRGGGYGRELFKAAEADAARKGITYLGLDGVTQQKQTYERRQFVSSPLGTVRIMMRGLDAREAVTVPESSDPIIDIRKVPKALLVQHELKYTGFERPALWSDEHMFHRRDVNGVAVVSKELPETIDDLKAWAVTRRCSGGVRIGPVYAVDATSAKAVLAAAIKLATPASIKSIPLPKESMNDWSEEQIVRDSTLVTEVWGGNPEAVKLFEEFGWQDAGVEYFRMWKNNIVPPEQSQGGMGQQGIYSIFDAATG